MKYSDVQNEDKIPGMKLSKEKFSALLGANASGIHRLKPVIMGKATRYYGLYA